MGNGHTPPMGNGLLACRLPPLSCAGLVWSGAGASAGLAWCWPELWCWCWLVGQAGGAGGGYLGKGGEEVVAPGPSSSDN